MKVTVDDSHNFKHGDELMLSANGMPRRLRWYDKLPPIARRLTRWWRPRTIVASVDHDAGEITFATQRFSWLRLKWVTL